MEYKFEKYKVENAEHKLICRHCCGRNCSEYYMPCTVLKNLPGHRLKILVFGERFWNDRDKKRIRYVDYFRVVEK